MSYVVLARKYRPRNFSEMVGQGHVVQALSNALTTQRLHHAYLFTGTRGVGKTTVSRILAKSLNCLGPQGQGGITAEPCGVCQACTDIDSDRFVDYTELDAASNRGIDDVQALLEQAVYKPVQGRFKVFMIDEVHMLTGPAFNSMLKTLEEPPAYLKFVLATTDPQKVPVTVLSRCLQFNLRPMAPETVLQHLQQVLQAEGVAADVASLRLIARAARGSMRDALSLTDQAIAFGGGQLQEATVRQMLGAVDRSYVLRLIDALARADAASVIDTIDTLRLNGLNAAATLEEMTGLLQRMAVLQAVPERAARHDLDDPDAPQILQLAQSLPADETQLLYSLCLHGRAELGLAPDEYAALTMVLLRLLAFKPMPDGAHVVGAAAEKKTLPTGHLTRAEAAQPAAFNAQVPALDAVARGPLPAASPAAPPQDNGRHSAREPPAALPGSDASESASLQVRSAAPTVAATPTPAASAEGDFWHQVVLQLVRSGAITALVRELGLQSQLLRREADQWLLRVQRESLTQGNSRERLCAALKTLGHDVRLVVEIGAVDDTPALRVAAAAQSRQRAAEAQILGDPFVQAMMRDFGGTIVPGSIQATLAAEPFV